MYVCVCVLTQPLAELRGRRRQAGDPARVAAQVLVLRRRGNVPHLHRRVSAVQRTTVDSVGREEGGSGVTCKFTVDSLGELDDTENLNTKIINSLTL